ncbi:MAG TPA: hypothetical protein VLF67_04010 [Candidatus Saccharimonas sp.]|nr:hypothetical protein [Candidatus Saccharimonas sp.]
MLIKRLSITALACLAFLATTGSIQAATNALAQIFTASSAKGKIVAGALVSAQPGASGSVELADAATADRLVGIAAQDAVLVITGNTSAASASASQVQVVLSGSASVLVSDLNGSIKAGDRITASPIAGVGMRAGGSSQIVGIAQTDLKTATAATRSITDVHGASHSVHVGNVQLQVGIGSYQAPGSNYLPPALQSLADSIAGRSVSLARIIICSLLLLVALVSVGVLIFTATRFAMIALGRNPLAASGIRKSLYQVIFVSVVIVGGALLASYIVLTL